MKYLKFFGLWFVLFWVVFLFLCYIPACQDDVTGITDFATLICCTVSLLVTFVVFLISDFNKIQKTKAQIPSLEANVKALEERRTSQLEQANKVLDKYLNHENAIQTAAANSHVDNGVSFKAVVESYPELSGNQAVASLMKQITDVENELVRMKTVLNAKISEYNGGIHTFPVSLFRKMLKLEAYEVAVVAIPFGNEAPITDEELGI